MEIREFQAVDAVARYKSITRAAEKMNISQQGLSGIIRKMEAECGFRIFERTPAGSRLTEEGEKLIRYITPVLAEYELAVGRIRKIQWTYLPKWADWTSPRCAAYSWAAPDTGSLS